MPPRTRKTTSAPQDAPERPRAGNGRFTRAITTAERDGEAARLKAEGWTYKEIAEQLGYASKGSACRAVQRALKAAVVPAAGALRLREFARLELLWESLEPGIEAGDVKAITEARKISESLRRLFDLDGAPETGEVEETERTAIDKLLADVEAWNRQEQAKIYGSVRDDG